MGALGTSIAAFVCFWGVGGVLGIALGFAAKSAIERSEGRLGGGTLALLGIVLGAANVLLTGLFLVGLALWDFRFTGTGTAPATTPSVALAPAPSPTPARSVERPAAAGRTSREHGAIATTVGSIHLIDLAPEDGLLQKQLAAELTSAERENQKVVLWTIRRDCKPCDGVAASLTDRRMQRALTKVRLVRVDVRDFAVELERLRVPLHSVPGFSLLGPESRVLDYVHGGEWDDDIAANIAPVLSEFVRGRYLKRRHPWRGGERDDDIPL